MLEYAMFTDAGNRPVNEDSIGHVQKGSDACFILCDGLGGHGMGDVASRMVRDVFERKFYGSNNMANFLADTFVAAQNELMVEQGHRCEKNKMKTTAVVLAVDDKNAYIGHVGDSRAYIFENNTVKIRTKDHSVPQILALCGEIEESEIRNHPERHIVLRVMGTEWEKPMYEMMKPISLQECQAFLLCSDGFWELIEEEEMCCLLEKANTPEEWIRDMVDVVKINGVSRNMDNFSAIAIWI